jgi:hypothetical protein
MCNCLKIEYFCDAVLCVVNNLNAITKINFRFSIVMPSIFILSCTLSTKAKFGSSTDEMRFLKPLVGYTVSRVAQSV